MDLDKEQSMRRNNLCKESSQRNEFFWLQPWPVIPIIDRTTYGFPNVETAPAVGIPCFVEDCCAELAVVDRRWEWRVLEDTELGYSVIARRSFCGVSKKISVK
jgi:hypothetical protein